MGNNLTTNTMSCRLKLRTIGPAAAVMPLQVVEEYPMKKQMKKFTIREVETVKTTSAFYQEECNITGFIGWLFGL
jgi:hypothetical protein